ncbi:MAG: ABC transporter substrate-binding protein [Firmicutes bacterium]|nr:ABC transporter substrate-binding protein [Bacillota bacterium]MBQ3123038.1 ABC transporter substrate-binding protein [Bacillota bacterium]
MKKKTRVLLSFIVVVVMVLSLSSCATYEAFYNTFIDKSEETYETVKIGVFEPLTGPDKEYGQLEKMGIELAHEIMPTCLAKPVELIYADHESDIYVAEAKIQELISKEPTIILGSYGNVYSMIAGDYVEEAKIPTIAITNTNPLVTANNSYYFRVSPVDSYQGIALAKFTFEHLGATQAAIIRPASDDVATALSSAYEDKLIQMTGDPSAVARTFEYARGTTDFESSLLAIKNLGIKAVFVPAGEDDAAAILKQAKEMGVSAIFIGTDVWATESFVEKAGDAVGLAVFSADYDADTSINETSEAFVKAFKAKYGEDAVPSPATALAYDAYMIAIESINRIGTVRDPEFLVKSLSVTSQHPGASGNITLGGDGDPMKTILVERIVNGEPVTIYVMEPTIVYLGI